MGGLGKGLGMMAGTAVGGPLGLALGGGLGSFADTAASGGNLYDSLGSGVIGGVTEGMMSGYNNPINKASELGSLGNTAQGSINESLLDLLSRAPKKKKVMYADDLLSTLGGMNV